MNKSTFAEYSQRADGWCESEVAVKGSSYSELCAEVLHCAKCVGYNGFDRNIEGHDVPAKVLAVKQG